MFGNINPPSQLLMAFIVTAQKGHEYSALESSERKEKMRAKGDMLKRAQAEQAMKTAQSAKKGTMA